MGCFVQIVFMKAQFKLGLRLWLALGAVTILPAANYFVAPKGDDRNAGTIERPWATLAGARDGVRASGKLGREAIVVNFASGVYYLDSTVVFSAEDSGSVLAPVLYRAAAGQKVVLSGATRLAAEWRPASGGIYAAPLAGEAVYDELFLDGALQPMARYPNLDPGIAVYGGFAADAISPERVSRWSEPAGGYIHAMHKYLWGGYQYVITGKNADGTLRYEGGWQNNRPMGMHDQYRYVENIREELDAPGEWYQDRQKHLLYFYPPAGADLSQARVELDRLNGLIVLRGTAARPVGGLGFSGFIFQNVSRTFMETREPLLRSDWRIYRGGALLVEGAEDCRIEDCMFEAVGGNAICVSRYNRRVSIRACDIRQAGASGVVFVGDPAAVRSPLFDYEQRAAYADIDRTPGARTDEYPEDCVVEDCLITGIGRVEKQVAGVEISMARRITVRHCTISGVPRAGINLGDGTWGGHLIEGCDVFDTVLETGDHGSFNSWGRDRYWQLRDAPEGELPALALLDAAEPVIIRNNRWRCDHGWDIDLDDGSSNFRIYNNLLLGGGLKLREGFHRHVWNNIIVNNSLHLHVWYPNSGDTFVGNIVMGRYRPGLMGTGRWGSEIDRNFFTTNAADRDAFRANGADLHSFVESVAFVDAAAGNFTLAADSPVLGLGFQNFPMDEFGVRPAKLRARAPRPLIPRLRHFSEAASVPRFTWLGATLRALQGEEYSAFGISAEAGGVVLIDAPGHAAATQAGLREGDVIYSLDGQAVRTPEDLQRLIQAAVPNRNLRLGVRREQRDVTVPLLDHPAIPTKAEPSTH